MSQDPLRQRLTVPPATLHEQRGARHLLVWGEVAQWLVVDGELHALLGRLDGRRDLGAALRDHARAFRRPLPQVAAEVQAVLPELRARGLLRAPGEAALTPAPEPVSLASVTVNLTNRCNLRCAFCYNADRRTAEQPVAALMDGVAAAGALLEPGASFIVLGGEPLLDLPRLLEGLDRAAGLFSTPALIATNGTRLDAGAIRELARRRVEVQVSLDAPTAARHDASRGAGVFDLALAGVRRLVASGVPTILSQVYTRDSLSELEPMLDLGLHLGVQEVRFIPLRRVGGGRDATASSPDPLATFRALMELLDRRPELARLLRRDWFTILHTLCRASARRTSCGIGRRVVLVDADGAVYPCPNHTAPEHRAGDVTREPLAEILLRSPVLQALRARYDVSVYTRCRTCAFRHWCAGDCRGEVLSVTGDPAAPSPRCAELRRVHAEMLWRIGTGTARLGGSTPLDARGALATFQ